MLSRSSDGDGGCRVRDWLRDPGYPTVDDEDVLSYLRAENA